MKAVIQRVNYAKCIIDGNLKGECKKGFMILLGVLEGDTAEDAEKLAKKVPVLRIFEDENGKMNRSCLDVEGEAIFPCRDVAWNLDGKPCWAHTLCW